MKNIDTKFKRELMTLADAADYLQVKKSYLYSLTSRKEIKHYKPRGKLIYFKRSELDQWAFRNPIITNRELDRDVQLYFSSQKRA